MRQSLFHKGLRSPIKLAGVVTEPGDTQLAESSAFRIILGFCLDDDGKRAKLRMLGQTEPGQDTLPLPDNILMLSPLYAMDISSIEEVQAVLKMHEIKK